MERGHRKGWPPSLGAIDARSLVPVKDDVGGIVLYLNGEPAYYVLNGEWFPAVPSPRVGAAAPAGAAVVPLSPLSDDELVGPPAPGETPPSVRPPTAS